MFDSMKHLPGRGTREKAAALVVTGMFVLGSVAMATPAGAGAKITNSFTFTGAYSGTIKLVPASLNCTYGKTYSGKGFLVTLSHMKGTITGAGKGEWAMSVYPSKKGTTKVTKANVQAYNDNAFQSNAEPIVQFLETSGSVTYEGATGSLDMTVEYHQVGSATYGKTATVTGSWNCKD